MSEQMQDKIWFLGRSYQEYLSMFQLDLDFLENKKILDCAAGASSFTSWAWKKGFKSTAIDILYINEPDVLKKIFIDDFSTLLQVHSGMDHKVDWGFFHNAKNMIQDRAHTYHDFIEDYERFRERYLPGQLPHLPFRDDQFNLALSSHFLFLYDDRLDYHFHLDSIREMLRVAEEVRIYPIVCLRGNGERSSFVERIIEDISHEGYLEIMEVDYRFRKGGNEMMKIEKKPYRSKKKDLRKKSL